ncbi:MAG TPA: hydrolase, partial [Polyangia bacterium]
MSAGAEAVSIPDLGVCARDRSRPISLDPARPVTIVVPGCRSSPEQLAPLARELEAEGQQALCFSYDDRETLERSARRLVTALEALKPHLVSRYITVLGHSQGGLIARRALVRDRPRALRDDGAFRYELVTVSSPFHGIESS